MSRIGSNPDKRPLAVRLGSWRDGEDRRGEIIFLRGASETAMADAEFMLMLRG